MNSPEIEQVTAKLRAKAQELREVFASEAAARALEWAAQEIEHATSALGEQLLSLQEASERSGYSEDHLARLVRLGRIPDLRAKGSKGRIRIRVADLPTRPAAVAGRIRIAYDPSADARALTGRP